MNSRRRTYVMTARADAAEETAARVVAAFTDLFVERGFDQVTLRAVAERAGVSVQTIIRRFGDKDGLTAAAVAARTALIDEQRRTAVPGDLDDIVDNLLDHYDAQARVALRLLVEEESTPAIARVTAAARSLHRDWCERVFAPWLDGLQGADRARRHAQLVALCDVYTWKLLHLDAGLARDEVRLALLEMLTPLTHGSP